MFDVVSRSGSYSLLGVYSNVVLGKHDCSRVDKWYAESTCVIGFILLSTFFLLFYKSKDSDAEAFYESPRLRPRFKSLVFNKVFEELIADAGSFQ